MKEARGRLIVLEGLDGSGKATQAGLLCQALLDRGEQVRAVSFPVYDSEASAPVRMYLRGDFGTAPGDVNAYAASAFYAVDRYASFRTDWGPFYRAGGTVIADRYATSNAIHQCAKLPEEQWDGYLDWLFDLEYARMGIPAPDLVIYLQTEPETSQRLLSGRYRGDESRKDIHEKDRAYQARSRQAAAYCVRRLGWRTVRCDRDGVMRPPEEIHREILTLLPQRSPADG